MKILVSDDSKTTLMLICSALEKLGHEVIPTTDGAQAIEAYKKQRPDLIILDVVMENGMDGFECAKAIRALEEDDWIPIIFLSGSVDDESLTKGIDAGGDDYLSKPFSEITLAAKIKAMQRISDMRKNLCDAKRKLMILSSTDALTGIYNRFQFDKTLKEKIAHTHRHQCAFALFFMDLDKFKFVNDSLGHHIGDLLLVEVAKRLKSCMRADDFLARIGGDEFAVILNEVVDATQSDQVAKKIIDLLSQPYQLADHLIEMSCSIGVAFYPTQGVDRVVLLQNADKAMYYAKKNGPNHYQHYSVDITNKKT